MYLIYTFFIFLLINLENSEGWYHFWHSKCDSDDSKKLETEKKLPEISNHLDDQCCPVVFKTIINAYKDKSDQRDVVPTCVKCAICLAIAENVETIFASTIENHKKCTPFNEKMCLEADLKALCRTGFVNYDLREYNGLSLLTDQYKETSHVRTPMDGLWTQMLRSSCRNLLNSLDKYTVYTAYKTGSLNVTNYLCKGFGVFRDCNNIKYDIIHLAGTDVTNVRFWVSCLFT